MESKTVPLGDTAVIECLASGSPKPRLTWTKDGGRLEATERHFFTADNQLLIIVKAMRSDAGTYECAMHNQVRIRMSANRFVIPLCSRDAMYWFFLAVESLHLQQ